MRSSSVSPISKGSAGHLFDMARCPGAQPMVKSGGSPEEHQSILDQHGWSSRSSRSNIAGSSFFSGEEEKSATCFCVSQLSQLPMVDKLPTSSNQYITPQVQIWLILLSHSHDTGTLDWNPRWAKPNRALAGVSPKQECRLNTQNTFSCCCLYNLSSCFLL